jgi:hypothetical protein
MFLPIFARDIFDPALPLTSPEPQFLGVLIAKV